MDWKERLKRFQDFPYADPDDAAAIGKALERIAELEALRNATCLWREETDGEYWSTECGQAHIFTVDGPRENSHDFCPYCRGRLIAVAEDGKGEMF